MNYRELSGPPDCAHMAMNLFTLGFVEGLQGQDPKHQLLRQYWRRGYRRLTRPAINGLVKHLLIAITLDT